MKRYMIGKMKLITSVAEIPEEDYPVLVSEKFDGMFAMWDGGVTRGTPKHEVPFANCRKDKKEFISTGLWSKYGNVIHAPDWFLDTLPSCGIAMELWAGHGKFQQVMSACKKHIPVDSEWEGITYIGLGRPDLNHVLRPGYIDYQGDFLITHAIKFPTYWKDSVKQPYELLQQLCWHPQDVSSMLAELPPEAEGLVIRSWDKSPQYDTSGSWPHAYKLKGKIDGSAKVIGHTAGRGKHEGLLGALEVMLPCGKRFFIGGGFTDFERANPPPIGSWIDFCYRELSQDGVPKEARFLRERAD